MREYDFFERSPGVIFARASSLGTEAHSVTIGIDTGDTELGLVIDICCERGNFRSRERYLL
jgi:hypothetical protein